MNKKRLIESAIKKINRKRKLNESWYDNEESMQRLGFPEYTAGGRVEAFEFITTDLGIDPVEIIKALSDDDVMNAIDYVLRVNGFYSELGDEDY